VSNNDWFKNLKVGDTVAVSVRDMSCSMVTFPMVIVRGTPTQWVLRSGDRLWKVDGSRVGDRYVVGGSVSEWTTGKRTAWADHRERQRLKQLLAEFDVDARSIHEVTAMLNWFMHNDKAKK